MKQTLLAIKTILSEKWYLLSFLALIPLIFYIFVLVPAKTIPGNSVNFQLSLLTKDNYILLGILSILESLFLIMQIFILKNAASAKDKVISLGTSGIGGYVAVVGSAFITVSCSSCLFALLGFLGLNTLFFLVAHQWYVIGGIIILLLLSIYFASKKINGICDVCNMGIKKSGK